MKRVIFLLFIGISSVSLPALSATLLLEGYFYKALSQQLVEPIQNVNLYANGVKIISDSKCTNKNPCKVLIEKKTTLTLCVSEGMNCHTGIRFDPTDSNIQRFAFVYPPSSFGTTPYVIYRPEEVVIIDEYLAKQAEAEKQRDEIKNRAPY